MTATKTNQNSIQVICPYWAFNTWVFDDEANGLEAEPFVSGAPELLSILARDIPNAYQDGFKLLFSPGPFPGYQLVVDWVREEHDGNWYKSDELGREGWLMPGRHSPMLAANRVFLARADGAHSLTVIGSDEHGTAAYNVLYGFDDGQQRSTEMLLYGVGARSGNRQDWGQWGSQIDEHLKPTYLRAHLDLEFKQKFEVPPEGL